MQRKIGPFEITEVLSPTTYRLQLPDTYPMHNMVNLQHLTKYHRSPDDSRPRLTNPRDILQSSEEYKVERIISERRSKGKTFYLVRWKGYDATEDSWQSARDLRNATDLLKEWHAGAEHRLTQQHPTSSLPLQPDPPSEPPQKSLSLPSASPADPKLHVMEVYFCFFSFPSTPLHLQHC